MKSVDRKSLLTLLGLATVFIVSRVLYDSAGFSFDGNTYLGYWQFIDPLLLRTDLLRSVFYLHSQPPLLNLFTGIVLQAFPANHRDVFHILFFTTGLILAFSIYFLGLAMRFPRWLALALSALFMLSPAAALYEHLLGYIYPLTAALVLSSVSLHHFIQTGKSRWGFLFFCLLASIALTWSLFHIIWLYTITAALIFVLPGRKKVVMAALLPVLLVTGWYAKNWYLVGEFTASSWAGMNLSRVTTFRVSEKERRELVRVGELSKFALILPFRNPSVYLELLPETPITGIPVWDETDTSRNGRNHHHLVYVQAGKFYLRDALRVITLKPGAYAKSVWQALYIYFHSTSDFDHIRGNRIKIRGLDLWWNRLFFGQWQAEETAAERLESKSAQHVGWWIAIGFLTAIAGGVLRSPRRGSVSKGLLRKGHGHLSEPVNLLVLFMLFNILFVTLVGNLMDIGENNRFRFVVDPFLLLLFIFFARSCISTFLNRNQGPSNTKSRETASQ